MPIITLFLRDTDGFRKQGVCLCVCVCVCARARAYLRDVRGAYGFKG